MSAFHISFDTRDTPGTLKALKIEIGWEFIRNPHRKMRVDLCDHPLYPQLEQYVLANPSPGRAAVRR